MRSRGAERDLVSVPSVDRSVRTIHDVEHAASDPAEDESVGESGVVASEEGYFGSVEADR